ncbi:MAG TPA: Spy/CpxP family protein refolding chaperone [Gemmatimonadaceae bacterium]|nr:Spy/CpxP family protein refolding chaperone [Gemmatimonadaceae bacterium]
MQFRRYAPALLALLIPAASFAQRGGGGGGGKTRGERREDWGDVMGSSSAGLKLSNGDVEDMNPVKLLVDKRKDLKLTDDQQKQIRAMNDRLKETNKPQFKLLDSLRNEIRPKAGADAQVEAIRTSMARGMVPDVVKVIRDNYDASLKTAIALLDDTQKAKADELLKTQAEEAEKTLQEKLGGPAGGRRGGPRP